MRVYSTKIISEEYSGLLYEQGLELDQDNFIAIENIHFDHPAKESDLIIFTSRRGVEALGSSISEFLDRAIAVVGEKAANALKTRGVDTLYIAEDAKDLMTWLDGRKYHSFIYYCSEQHLPDLPNFLEERGARFKVIPVYRTSSRSQLLPPVDYDVVMFYSPSGVKSFFERNTWKSNCRALAIGKTTAQALNDYVNKELIYTAPHPNMHSCIEKCIELVKNRTEI